ncbi:transglycosylase domain-containing protein [Pacificispira sp.]|uniref:transglycosylase domain-containing protein n=1 Tax=Pacificispira sp. TaxID=2888761 RepID=UPI003B517BEE
MARKPRQEPPPLKRGGARKSAAKKAAAKKTAARKSPSARPARGRSGRPPRRFWPRLLRGAVSVLIWGLVLTSAVIGWFAWDMPDPEEVLARDVRRPGVTILAADGTELLKVGDLYGHPVKLTDLPPHLPHALLATEDRRFYYHPGVDPIGIARALYTNIAAGGVRQGGSTLTQQLAKNLFLSRDRTIRRKVQEALLAFWLEARYGKDRILEIYLNRIYLGAGAYGVDAAARRYFGVPAAQVSLWQAAVLAGLPKAPSALNPFRSPQKSAERAREVLDDMVRASFITADQAQAAKRDSVATLPIDTAGAQTRWLAEWAVDRAADILGGVDRDILVETTLESDVQRAAEAAAAQIGPEARAKGASELALVAMRPDGAVAALLGGADRRGSAFNRAVHGKRQPGSSFKLFVYLAAFEGGLTPDTPIDDRIAPIEGWSPRNAGAGYRGVVTLREGVARSINTVAVAAMETVGRSRVVDMARRLGITANLNPDPALALGVYEVSPMEMAGAYTTVAAGGHAATPYIVRRVRDAADGSVIYEREGGLGPRILSPQVVAMTNDVLGASVAWGTSKAAALPGRPAAGKTGTTQDYRDAWFAGYTPQLTAVIWMGNDNGLPTDGVYGGLYPAQMWRVFMEQALSGEAVVPLARGLETQSGG